MDVVTRMNKPSLESGSEVLQFRYMIERPGVSTLSPIKAARTFRSHQNCLQRKNDTSIKQHYVLA